MSSASASFHNAVSFDDERASVLIERHHIGSEAVEVRVIVMDQMADHFASLWIHDVDYRLAAIESRLDRLDRAGFERL